MRKARMDPEAKSKKLKLIILMTHLPPKKRNPTRTEKNQIDNVNMVYNVRLR